MKKLPPLKTADDFMAHAKQLNPNNEPLTVERLKRFPGCEHYTDEEALHIVQSIEQLALIIYECAAQDSLICIENQHVVYCNHQKQAA